MKKKSKAPECSTFKGQGFICTFCKEGKVEGLSITDDSSIEITTHKCSESKTVLVRILHKKTGICVESNSEKTIHHNVLNAKAKLAFLI